MTNYTIATPPVELVDLIDLRLRDRTAADLRSYRDWFLRSLEERIGQLERAIRSTNGFTRWSADFSLASFHRVDDWFCSHVGTELKDAATLERHRSIMARFGEPQGWWIDYLTLSYCLDIAMYMGEVVKHLADGADWTQRLGSRRSVDFGQMVVGGLPVGFLNPILVVHNRALSIAKGNLEDRPLGSLIGFWVES